MKMKLASSFCGLVVISMPANLAAADDRTPVLEAVTKCRAVTDPMARLDCYDRSVAALDLAERKHDVAVVDRTQVRETKKKLFGLSLPRLPIFGQSDDGQEVSQIETTLVSATTVNGGWLFHLADNSNWRQIDDNELGRKPRLGDAVVVKRAALGSFRMTIANLPGIKVRREN